MLYNILVGIQNSMAYIVRSHSPGDRNNMQVGTVPPRGNVTLARNFYGVMSSTQ